MKSSKIYHLLSQLPLAELREFKKFLASPIFNRKVEFSLLLEMLEKHLFKKNAKNLTEADFWHLCFPDKAFNLKKIRNLKSEMVSLLREFLAFREYQKDPDNRDRALLKAQVQLRFKDEFRQQFAKTSDLRTARLTRNAAWSLEEFQLNSIRSRFEAGESTVSNFAALEKSLQYLDEFYLPARLRVVTALLDAKEVQAERRMTLIQKTTQQLLQAGPEKSPVLRIYEMVFLSQKELETESHYHNLKELLSKFRELLSSEEIRDLYTHQLNYALRKANRGTTSFRKEAGIIYGELLELGILMDNGRIAPEDFRNIVTVMAGLEEFEWTAAFIEEFRSRIGPDHAENALNFSLSIYNFFQQDYSASRKWIEEVLRDFEHAFYNFAGRRLLLMINYELEEFDLIQSGYDAYRMFLNRNKKKFPWYQEGARNFGAFLRDLIRIRFGTPEKRKERLSALEENISECRNLPGKKWLLRKIKEAR